MRPQRITPSLLAAIKRSPAGVLPRALRPTSQVSTAKNMAYRNRMRTNKIATVQANPRPARNTRRPRMAKPF